MNKTAMRLHVFDLSNALKLAVYAAFFYKIFPSTIGQIKNLFKGIRWFTHERLSLLAVTTAERKTIMKKAIAYYRVSTERQGVSGLGLDAQKQAVQDFVRGNGLVLAGEHIEIEKGKNRKRPILLQTLADCKHESAILLIAKLDRLARNVAFISALMEARVEFTALDIPYASKLVVHIMAAFAEYERDRISERTTDALKVAKSRGVVLGSYGRDVLSIANKQAAYCFALSILPIISDLRQNGITTIREIAGELNRLKIPTYRHCGCWHPTTVHSLIKRLNYTGKPKTE